MKRRRVRRRRAGWEAAQSSDEELEELGEELEEELEEEFGEGLEEEFGEELVEEEDSDVDIEVQPRTHYTRASEQYEAILRESGRIEADHSLKWRLDLKY